MPGPLLNRHVTVRHGAFLPHWTADATIYHVVFRLVDSLPAEVVERYRRERDAQRAKLAPDTSLASREAPDELFSERIDAYLDSGRGACWLGQPIIAEIAARALQHFDGQRYDLFAWCVMPNHVHAVVRPGSHDLPSTLHTWKSYTASESNRSLGRSGKFWQKESYDHIVRDESELERTICYIVENPSRAGLLDWRWTWRRSV